MADDQQLSFLRRETSQREQESWHYLLFMPGVSFTSFSFPCTAWGQLLCMHLLRQRLCHQMTFQHHKILQIKCSSAFIVSSLSGSGHKRAMPYSRSSGWNEVRGKASIHFTCGEENMSLKGGSVSLNIVAIAQLNYDRHRCYRSAGFKRLDSESSISQVEWRNEPQPIACRSS